MASETFSARLPEDLSARVERYIKEARITKAQLLKRALDSYLDSPDAHEQKGFLISDRSVGNTIKMVHLQLDASFSNNFLAKQINSLKTDIKRVPYDVKVQIFIEAHKFFKNCLRNSKNADPNDYYRWIRLLDKTIPIFEALVESSRTDTLQNQDHRCFAFLSYALAYKASRQPNFQISNQIFKQSLEYLDHAISIRDEEIENPEFHWYEFKKAIFLVQSDENFYHGKQSTPKIIKEVKTNIELSISMEFFADLISKLEFFYSDGELSDKQKYQIKWFIYETSLTVNECETLIEWLTLNSLVFTKKE